MSAAWLGRWIRLDRLGERDRRALLLGLLVLAPALAWSAVLRPYLSALEDVRGSIDAERGLLERERALLVSGPGLPGEAQRALESVRAAEGRLVAGANPALAEAQLIEYLSLVASTSRVLLQEARGTDEVADGDDISAVLPPLGLALRGESDLAGVLAFLRTIEQSPLLLRVRGLSMEPVMTSPQPAGRGGGPPQPARPTGVLRFSLLIEGYARPDMRVEVVPPEPRS